MWPFKKKPLINGPQNVGFDDTFMGVSYRSAHQKMSLPDPGAQNYAWVTLALPAFTPIGPATHAGRDRLHVFDTPPMISQQGGIVTGIPTQAGQFIHQPLLNPLTGP